MLEIAPNLRVIHHPLSVLGTRHGRTVSVIRLSSGKLVIHSTAPFTPAELAQIQAWGEPAWLVEAMLLHDTYAAEGRRHFPGLPFLGPPGFGEVVKFPVPPLIPPPDEWAGEIQVVRLRGAPKLEEHVFLHVGSRTLIVADLVFNFSEQERMGPLLPPAHRRIQTLPGDEPGFQMVRERPVRIPGIGGRDPQLDFDRIIPGHGGIIESGGKEKLRTAMEDAGFA